MIDILYFLFKLPTNIITKFRLQKYVNTKLPELLLDIKLDDTGKGIVLLGLEINLYTGSELLYHIIKGTPEAITEELLNQYSSVPLGVNKLILLNLEPDLEFNYEEFVGISIKLLNGADVSYYKDKIIKYVIVY